MNWKALTKAILDFVGVAVPFLIVAAAISIIYGAITYFNPVLGIAFMVGLIVILSIAIIYLKYLENK